MARQFNSVLADSWLGLLNFDSTTNARGIGSTLPTTLDSNQGQGQPLRGQPGESEFRIPCPWPYIDKAKTGYNHPPHQD
jgi:hypothetical protein